MSHSPDKLKKLPTGVDGGRNVRDRQCCSQELRPFVGGLIGLFISGYKRESECAKSRMLISDQSCNMSHAEITHARSIFGLLCRICGLSGCRNLGKLLKENVVNASRERQFCEVGIFGCRFFTQIAANVGTQHHLVSLFSHRFRGRPNFCFLSSPAQRCAVFRYSALHL